MNNLAIAHLTTAGERAVVALKRTSVIYHLTYLNDTLPRAGRQLVEWAEDDNRFEMLGSILGIGPNEIEGVAFTYGCVLGIAEAYEIPVTRLVQVWKEESR